MEVHAFMIPMITCTCTEAREEGLEAVSIWRLSKRATIECAEALSGYVDKYSIYNEYGCHLDSCGVIRDMQVEYGLERVRFMLALTVYAHKHDGRISGRNIDWAQNVLENATIITEDRDRWIYMANGRVHMCLIDGLATSFRKYFETSKTN